MLAAANNDVRVRTMDAARHAGAVIANFAAYPFGIGGVGECKPQGGGCDADEEFCHRQPPLRPLRSASAVPPAYQVPRLRFGSRQSGELLTPRLSDHGPKVYGFLCRRYNYLRDFGFTHCSANSHRDHDGGLAAPISLGAKT